MGVDWFLLCPLVFLPHTNTCSVQLFAFFIIFTSFVLCLKTNLYKYKALGRDLGNQFLQKRRSHS